MGASTRGAINKLACIIIDELTLDTHDDILPVDSQLVIQSAGYIMAHIYNVESPKHEDGFGMDDVLSMSYASKQAGSRTDFIFYGAAVGERDNTNTVILLPAKIHIVFNGNDITVISFQLGLADAPEFGAIRYSRDLEVQKQISASAIVCNVFLIQLVVNS